jgi:Clostridium P-47 protein
MTTVSTNNWDTAFGIRFKDANAAIVAKGSTPAGFTGQHTIVGATLEVAASFGPWQMNGGSGSLLQMAIPLTAGTVSGAGQDPAAFAGSAVIQVSLDFIPQPGSTQRELKLDAGRGVSVLSVALTSGPASAQDAIRGALQDWLGDHLDEFNHVFAAVDLNTSADTGAFSWLKPTHLGYAIYTEGFTSVDDYLFGVLAMTDHRHGERLSPALDPGVIPSGSDAGFLISPARIVDKMFEPNVETLFKDAPAASFDRLDAGMTLYNTTPLNLPDFTMSDGRTITDAAINTDGFNLAIGSGSVIISFMGMTFTYAPGYTVTVNYRSVNAMATDDNGHLQLTQTGTPTVSISISETSDQKWKEIWEGIGIAIGAAIVGAVLGAAAEAGLAARAAARAVQAGIDAAADGGEVAIELELVGDALTPADRLANEVQALRAAVEALQEPEVPMTFAGFFRANAFKLLGAAIGAAVGGAVGSIPAILDGYADEDRKRMPTLDNFAAKAIGSTTWSGSQGYTLSSAALHGSLQLGLKKSA